MTNTQLKTKIDADITNKTTADSVTTDNVGENLKDIVDYVDQESENVKIYKAKLAQSGTGNITATILKNNTGLTITFARNSVGSYNVSFSSLLPDLNKVDLRVNFQTASYQCPQVNIDNLGILATLETRFWNGTTFALSDEIINNGMLYLTIHN
jgi:hypothetical protein